MKDQAKTKKQLIAEITELRRAESALRERLESFEALADKANDGILIARGDGVPVYANTKAADITGYSIQELLGMQMSDLAAPKEKNHILRRFGQGKKGKVSHQRYETRIVGKDGRDLLVDITITKATWEGRPAVNVLFRDMTDQRQAEEALRRSEANFRGIIDNIPDIYYRADMKGTLILANIRGAEILGYESVETVIGKNVADTFYYHPAERQVFLKTLKEKGKIRNFETLLKKKDGQPIPVEVNSQFVYHNSKPIAIEGIARDISERKQSEKALKEKENLLSKVLFASQVGICLLENRVIRWGNEALRTIFGFHGDNNYIGRTTDFVYISKEDYERVGRELYPALKGGPPIEYDLKMKRADGTLFDAHFQVATLNPENPIESIVFTVADVTDRKRAEKELTEHRERLVELVRERTDKLETANLLLKKEIAERRKAEAALRESMERFREMADLLPTVIAEYDTEEKFTYINKVGAKALRVTPADIEKGIRIRDLIPDSEKRKYARRVRALMQGRRPAPAEYRLLRADGKEVFALINAAPIVKGGQVEGVRITINDITELKKAEKELLSNQERLRRMGAELSLAEERERRRIAMDLHDHIGQCLAISKLKLKTLRHWVSSSEVTPALDEILELVEQMTRDTRSLTMELSPPILYDLGLGPALEWLTEEIHDKYRLNIYFQSPKPIDVIDIDLRVVLFRAVRELLTNVVKHARASEAHVLMSSEKGNVKIEVRDDGIGFDVSGSLRQIGGSTGFGIFSVRERMNSFGGRIDIESESNQGTRVFLAAPLKPKQPKKRKTKSKDA